jgi:hypothetical protein
MCCHMWTVLRWLIVVLVIVLTSAIIGTGSVSARQGDTTSEAGFPLLYKLDTALNIDA